MSNFNQITLIGRVGKDPDVKTLEAGKIAKTTLAVTEKVTRDGGRVDDTEWFNVTMFGKVAEVAENYIRKGDLLFIQGRFKSRKYTDKEGEEKVYQEILVHQMQMLGSKREKSETGNPASEQRKHEAEPVDAEPVDDLPF